MVATLNMAETNIERLDRMFPSVLTLNAQQTAEALGWERARIYKLAAKLPFIKRVGDLVVIPKLALADWLDGKVPEEPKKVVPAAIATATAVQPKRKVGRPLKSLSQRFFAQSLMFELDRHEYQQAIDACKSIVLRQDDERGRKSLDALFELPGKQLAQRERFELEFG